MKGFREKCKNPPFLGILAKNGPFWTVFGQNGRNMIFFKKEFGTFFPPLQALTNCKVSEKSNERISRYFRTDGRTNGRTDEQELNSRFLRINIRRTNKDFYFFLGKNAKDLRLKHLNFLPEKPKL